MGEGSIQTSMGKIMLTQRGHLKYPRVKIIIWGAGTAEIEKLRVRDDVFARGRVRGGIIKLTVKVSRFAVEVST